MLCVLVLAGPGAGLGWTGNPVREQSAAQSHVSAPREGIPFGPWSLPENLLGAVYTGAVRDAKLSNVLSMLQTAQRARARVALMLAGGTKAPYKNRDGSFNQALWKERVDRFTGIDFAPYIADGTLLGHVLLDEPHAAGEWDGKPVPFSEIEAIARYSKERWPDLTTFVRAQPEFLAGAPFPWVYLDAAWAQYSARHGDVGTYALRNAESARSLRLGLVLGMNVLDGGTSESAIPGYTDGKWAMSANQIKTWGSVLAAEPYGCGLFMWRHKASPVYFERPDIRDAVAEVSRVATNRPTRSCRAH